MRRYAVLLAVLMLAALGIFSYWLLDGPVRDYLHTMQKPAQAAVSATASALTGYQAKQSDCHGNTLDYRTRRGAAAHG